MAVTWVERKGKMWGILQRPSVNSLKPQINGLNSKGDKKGIKDLVNFSLSLTSIYWAPDRHQALGLVKGQSTMGRTPCPQRLQSPADIKESLDWLVSAPLWTVLIWGHSALQRTGRQPGGGCGSTRNRMYRCTRFSHSSVLMRNWSLGSKIKHFLAHWSTGLWSSLLWHSVKKHSLSPAPCQEEN